MSGDNTKERILDTSLKMFSKRGFHAVSIRDICKEVKIKESSVYYHFKNKRAILDELQLRFEAKATDMMRKLDSAITDPCEVDEVSGEAVSKIFFEDYLMDDFCNSFMRLLYMEQNEDAKMQIIYDKWLFQEPLRFQSKVFTILCKKADQAADSEYLAMKYYAPIFLLFQRYLLTGELTEEKKNEFCNKTYYHINCFFKEMGETKCQILL